MHAMKRMNNDVAVSPIVATLVLIVVAVIGAVAVGTIMGTFSTDVSKKASAEGASSASQTEILSAGSTTVQPASELIAKAYMAENPGVKITVQGGGSGAGVQSVGEGIVDIGASSALSKITDKINDGTYPNLKYYQIGASGVVWIVNKNSAVSVANQTDLDKVVTGGAAFAGDLTGITKLVQRSDSSGTEETAAGWVNSSLKSFDNTPTSATTTAAGNPGVLAEIAGNNAGNEIGFVDYGYIFDNSGKQLTTGNAAKVNVLSAKMDVSGTMTTFTVSRTNVLNACKDLLNSKVQGTTNNYPQGLTRGLYYITNGQPNSVVKNYITFAQSPGATDSIHDAGMFGNADLA